MTIDTDAPGAGDLMLVLIMLVPVALALLGAVWLVGATLARGSLERWPRLLVNTAENYRLLRAWVMFVPVVGPLTYGVAWCVGRAELDPLRREHVRTPFGSLDGKAKGLRSTEMSSTQGPPTGRWPVAAAGQLLHGAQRPAAPITGTSWSVPGSGRAGQEPPHGWPPR